MKKMLIISKRFKVQRVRVKVMIRVSLVKKCQLKKICSTCELFGLVNLRTYGHEPKIHLLIWVLISLHKYPSLEKDKFLLFYIWSHPKIKVKTALYILYSHILHYNQRETRVRVLKVAGPISPNLYQDMFCMIALKLIYIY